jgi:hypothetical protein
MVGTLSGRKNVENATAKLMPEREWCDVWRKRFVSHVRVEGNRRWRGVAASGASVPASSNLRNTGLLAASLAKGAMKRTAHMARRRGAWAAACQPKPAGVNMNHETTTDLKCFPVADHG